LARNEQKITSVNLTLPLWKIAKQVSLDRDMSLAGLIRQALKQYLQLSDGDLKKNNDGS